MPPLLRISMILCSLRSMHRRTMKPKMFLILFAASLASHISYIKIIADVGLLRDLTPELAFANHTTARTLADAIEEDAVDGDVVQQGVVDDSNGSNNALFNFTPEFDYPLSCPQPSPIFFKKRMYQVALVYHVGMMNNWKNVVADQLLTLSMCGLGDIASSLVVTYAGSEDPTELRQLLDQYPFARNAQMIHAPAMPWEQEAMYAVKRMCDDNHWQKQEQRKIVFYFHNKGISRFSEDWRDTQEQQLTYSRVLYWRKFMEYFTLERPHLCLQKISEEGALTCGVNFRSGSLPVPAPHYSGNFWAASCEFIHTMPAMSVDHCRRLDMEYLCAEMWMGTTIPKSDENRTLFVDLHPQDELLYVKLMRPEEYMDLSL